MPENSKTPPQEPQTHRDPDGNTPPTPRRIQLPTQEPQLPTQEPQLEVFSDTLDQDIGDIVAMAESRMNAVEKLKKHALKMTSAADYTLEGEKPYLTITGAEKIAPFFNVDVRLHPDYIGGKKEEFTMDGQAGYRYWYMGTGRLLSRTGGVVYQIEGLIGSASTRDKMYKRTTNGDKAYLSMEEIDEADIRKSALSDLLRSCCTRLLGLRSLTLEDIKAAGISPDSIKSTRAGSHQATTDEIKQRDELRQTLARLCSNDPNKCREWLKNATAFKGRDQKEVPGIDNPDKLSGKRLEIALEKVKNALAEFEKGARNGKSV